MSNNSSEKTKETVPDSKEESVLSPPDDATTCSAKASPENPPKDEEVNSEENIDTNPTKETSSIKSNDATQATGNNLSGGTSPKASCSYQDFGRFRSKYIYHFTEHDFLSDSSSSRSPRSTDRHIFITNNKKSIVCRLRLEIENLQAEVIRLRGLVVSSASNLYTETNSEDKDDPATKIASLQKELLLAKEAITSKSFRSNLNSHRRIF